MTDSNSTTDPLQRIIERAVREVLAAKLRESHGAAEPRGAADSRPAAVVTSGGEPGSRWRVERSPVTLADLENAPLKQLKELTVPARAVITPAVRDVLRGHRIELRFEGAAGSTGAPTNGSARRTSAHLLDADGRGRDADVRAMLARRGIELAVAADCARLIGASSAGERALVVADVPQPIVARIFQTGQRIAAQIADLAAIDDVAHQMQPDVWVIDGRHASLPQIAALVERCLKTGAS